MIERSPEPGKAGRAASIRQHRRAWVLPVRLKRIVLAVVLVATFGAGAVSDRIVGDGGSDAGAASSLTDLPEFQTFQETWDLIHENYVDEEAIDDKALIYGATKGMVESLGDTGHTTFLDPEEAKAYEESTRGELIGIGVQIDYTSGRPVVIAPIDGSPADEAGIRAGDVIAEVDGQATAGMTQTQVFGLIRGDEGTSVEIAIERPADGSRFTVTLERRKITEDIVSWSMLPGNVAHIRLSQFSVGAAKEVKSALREAKGQGATAVIFDLRDNPGGLVFEAIGVASQFLPEGKAIYLYQERDKEATPIRTTGVGEGVDLPLVVLINGGSASAAEIVASAMHENGRAPLIGQRTFGTGTVLSPVELEDGSVVLLGTAFWLTADGDEIWHKGVEPTEAVELAVGAAADRPADDDDVTAAELQASEDAQLVAAHEAVATDD